MNAALPNYHARMQRVLDHIDRHLDDDLDLDAMSGVAAFSKFHFHRRFTAALGLSTNTVGRITKGDRPKSSIEPRSFVKTPSTARLQRLRR
jgi:AraC family transcriptional regulator